MLMACVMHCAISRHPTVGDSHPYPCGGRARFAMFIISSRNWGDCTQQTHHVLALSVHCHTWDISSYLTSLGNPKKNLPIDPRTAVFGASQATLQAWGILRKNLPIDPRSAPNHFCHSRNGTCLLKGQINDYAHEMSCCPPLFMSCKFPLLWGSMQTTPWIPGD